jgi:hypothetical protein
MKCLAGIAFADKLRFVLVHSSRGPAMPIRPLISLTMAVSLALPAVARAQVPYTYTRVATTGAGSGFAGLYPPQINQVGSVAFGATLTNGGQGIFVGTLGVVVPIEQNGAIFTGFNFPPGPIIAAIAPNSNTTAFFASRTAAQGGGVGVFTSDSVTRSTIAATGAGFTNFGIGVDINAGNNVAFTASSATAQGVLIGAPGAPLTTAASTTGGFFSSFSGAVAINNSGQTSFSAGKTAAAGGGAGIFRFTPGGAGIVEAIAQTGGTFNGFGNPSDINNAGQVAFLASRTVGGFGIFRGNGAVIDPIATSGASFTTFGDAPSINSSGGVVFAANLTGGGQGIFTGPNPILNHVIRTGDTLDGSTITSVAFAAGGLNDLGQIAFVATLADGRQTVFIATPVPEPASILLLGGTALAAGAWWRRRTWPTAGRRLRWRIILKDARHATFRHQR